MEIVFQTIRIIDYTVSRTGEYATGLLDKFKSNIIAIFGFLFTVILAMDYIFARINYCS